MKTLYISDLDGTLFNKDKKISAYTAQVLNECIRKGMLFSVATARMPYGCDYRLKEIKMNTPGILTNGVFIYDFKTKSYVSAEGIITGAARKAIQVFKENGLSCFVYIFQNNNISIYYDDKKLEGQTQYYSDRALENCKEVRMVGNYEEILNEGDVCYLTYTGEKEELATVCRQLDMIRGVSYSFYLNIYNGLYCLEVFSDKANKQNALIRLKEIVKCDEIVVFGDNLNDIPMIEIADRSYAPANALEEVKEIVDGILENCDHDGVAKMLEREILEEALK